LDLGRREIWASSKSFRFRLHENQSPDCSRQNDNDRIDIQAKQSGRCARNGEMPPTFQGNSSEGKGGICNESHDDRLKPGEGRNYRWQIAGIGIGSRRDDHDEKSGQAKADKTDRCSRHSPGS